MKLYEVQYAYENARGEVVQTASAYVMALGPREAVTRAKHVLKNKRGLTVQRASATRLSPFVLHG